MMEEKQREGKLKGRCEAPERDVGIAALLISKHHPSQSTPHCCPALALALC